MSTSLTVGQLITILSRHDQSLPVVITMNQEYESWITEHDIKVLEYGLDASKVRSLYIGDVE
jgi:hypothetical protein